MVQTVWFQVYPIHFCHSSLLLAYGHWNFVQILMSFSQIMEVYWIILLVLFEDPLPK
jgi:hypothetical protein